MVRRRFERVAAAFGNLSLSAKGVLVVAIPVAALLVAMGVFYLLEQETRQAHGWVEHTFQVRAEIERVMLLLARAETPEGYQTAVRELPQPLSALEQMTKDNPAQSQRLAGLRPRIESALEDTDAIRRDSEADQLLAELATVRAEEDRLLADRSARELQAGSKLEIAVFGGGLLGLLGGVIGALVFASGVGGRVRLLEEAAEQMAAGLPVTTKFAAATIWHASAEP